MDDLLALAESLDLEHVDLSHLAEPELDTNSQQLQWDTPPMLDLIPALIDRSTTDVPSLSAECEVIQSPTSPTQRNRVLLFAGSEKPIELVTSGESSDPRCLYVMDHPGRNAQFKNWFSSGLIKDDSRRVTFREESSGQACWHQTGSSVDDDAATDLLNLIRVVKSEESPQNIQSESRIPPVPADAKPGGLGTHIRDLWDAHCIMVGGSIVVSMAYKGLDDSLMRTWCMWFNDKLCFWGLNDRPMSSLESQFPVDVMADLDFSGNQLGDASLKELLRLLSAFRRIHVRTLRLSCNSLTRTVLDPIKTLPYISHLVIDDNNLTSDDVVSWIPEIIMSKQEHYDILVAQDIPDESVRQALFLNVERNRLSRPLELIHSLNCLGINVCIPESTGCEPYSTCRLYGEACGIHLAGLSQQQDPRLI